MAYSNVSNPLHKLILTGKQQFVTKGAIVSGLGDASQLHLIAEGYVKRYMITSDGERSIQVIYGPGDILPLTPVYKAVFDMNIYRGSETYYYEAITRTSLYSIELSVLMRATEQNPLLYKDMFFAAGVRLNSYIHRLEDTSLGEVHRRIAHLLLYFADQFGKQGPGGIRIDLPVTHQLLAETLNLARETITRRLAKLEDEGLIVGGRNILIKDIDRLKEEADVL